MAMIVVVGICLIALFGVLEALFPRTVERTRRVADESPRRALLIGLVNLIFLVAAGFGIGALHNRSALAFFVLLAFMFLMIGITLGLAGMVQVVGSRLFPERIGLQRTGWGAGALVLACLVPYVGWFGLLPYLALTGLGAFLLSWFGEPSQGPVGSEALA
jgi:hypothetical protein